MPNLPDSPKDASVLISPTDPLSVGGMVKLTCSCRGSPPVLHFIWFITSDARLELISVNTQVYGFNVSNSDRGRLFCGCANSDGLQFSPGRQLVFEGNSKDDGLRSF